MRWKLITHNPCKDVSLPKEVHRKVQPLTPEQAQHLLAVVRGQKLEALLALAVTAALRHGEMTSLRWSDINFDDGIMSIHSTLNYLPKYKYVEGEPKTETSNRKILLPPFVLELLKEHRMHLEELV